MYRQAKPVSRDVRIASTLRLAGLVAAYVVHAGAAFATDAQSIARIPDATRRHIGHIESHLLPAVLVDGEATKTATLASKMSELGVPGVSIAFIHRGRLTWTDVAGVTRLEGPAVDSNTVFQAASISKPVTAMAVMALAQSGRLALDREVNDYLASWKLADGNPTATERVTIRRLLSHTAGTTVHGFDGYAHGQPVPTLEQILDGEAPANSPPVRVATVPGTAWSYSGGGYLIVQQMLTDLTKTPFAKLMQESILKPIGMRRSSFEQPNAAFLQQNAATPYDSKGIAVSGGAHTYPEQSAAGLWTTPSDLARFAIDLQHSLAGKTGVLLPVTAREMLRPVGKGSWSIGFRVGGGDHPYFMHSGWNAGFRSLLMAFDAGDGIVIMTNGDAGVEIASALLRTAAVEYGWPEFQPRHHRALRLPSVALDRFVGKYRLSEDVTITVLRKNARLYIEFPEEAMTEIIPESRSSFFSKTSDMQASFRFGADRRAIGMNLYAGMNHGAANYRGNRIE
jgi:CubicO group peptidase (beta-lactamase class C family)